MEISHTASIMVNDTLSESKCEYGASSGSKNMWTQSTLVLTFLSPRVSLYLERRILSKCCPKVVFPEPFPPLIVVIA